MSPNNAQSSTSHQKRHHAQVTRPEAAVLQPSDCRRRFATEKDVNANACLEEQQIELYLQISTLASDYQPGAAVCRNPRSRGSRCSGLFRRGRRWRYDPDSWPFAEGRLCHNAHSRCRVRNECACARGDCRVRTAIDRQLQLVSHPSSGV